MSREVRTEWRVRSESSEDDFGTDEKCAREWVATCEEHPQWEPVVLERREVVIETHDWTEATR